MPKKLIELVIWIVMRRKLKSSQCRFTSARLLTRGRFSFTYGVVEARIKVPFGQGIWPAIWMLGENFGEVGWTACGEIDIMENIGRESGIVHGIRARMVEAACIHCRKEHPGLSIIPSSCC